MAAAPYHYRYATLEQLGTPDCCTDTHDWLGGDEQRTYRGLRDPRRRRCWLAGRLLAKRLIFEQLRAEQPALKSLHLSQIEINSTDVHGRGWRPQVSVNRRRLPWSLSISHSGRAVLVALADRQAASVGVDLIEPKSYGDGFAKCWLTPAERNWVRGQADPATLATIWALKEAVYKAVNRGEKFQPRAIEIVPGYVRGFVYSPAHGGPAAGCKSYVWRTQHNEIAAMVIHPL